MQSTNVLSFGCRVLGSFLAFDLGRQRGPVSKCQRFMRTGMAS